MLRIKELYMDNNNNNETKKQSFLQILKYLLCAGSAGIIQMCVFTLLTFLFKNVDLGTMWFIIPDMEVTLFLSTTLALFLSVLWNFTFNRKFTFHSAGNVPKAMFLAFLFYIPFYPFQTWYVHAVSQAMSLTNLELGKILAEASILVINCVLEFCWQKFVVFRKEKSAETKE